MMDESDFQSEESAFDSSVMRSGIPKSMDKVVPLEEDNADLVYRNVDVMSNSSVRRAAGGDFDSPMLRSVGLGKEALSPSPFLVTAAAKPSVAALTGKYQVSLGESPQQATQRVTAFLAEQSITSAHRMEAATHCWDCYAVSGSCQLVKFQIQAVQCAGSVVVDFKRERGCCDALAQTFEQFRRSSGCAAGSSRGGRFRTQPPPLPDDDDEEDCCGAVEQALSAMSQWLQTSPVEALQSLGQLYGNRCQHLLRSENLLADVCKSIRAHEVEETDMIALALGLSCLRKILSIYSELSQPSPMSQQLLGGVRRGLARAAHGRCLTARREARLTLETINATVPTDQRILNL